MRFLRGWQSFEEDVQNVLGLSATVASGSQFYDKGDAVDRRHPSLSEFILQVEAKYTEKGSFSVNAKKMSQWLHQARLSGRNFALAIRVWPLRSAQPEDWVVIPMDDYARLIDFSRTREEWAGLTDRKITEIAGTIIHKEV